MEKLIPLFTFPVNLIFAVLWIGFSFYAWKNARSSGIVRFFLSSSAVISSIALFLGSCLWIGISGDRDFVRSYFFVAVLIY